MSDTPGHRIKQAADATGMSVASVARAVGMHPQDLNKITSGRVRKSKHFPAIAEALGVPVEWLTTGEGPAPPWFHDESDHDCSCNEMREIIAEKDAEIAETRQAIAALARQLASEQEARERAESLLAQRAAARSRGRGAAG